VVEPLREAVRLRVPSQGTVAPRTESELVAEVSGRVVDVSPSLEPGAFFQKGEVLAELDRRDLELAVARARAARELALAERDYARATLARQQTLAEREIASDARLDEVRRAARVADARGLEAAAELERAERDLERTRIVAPYDGRVRTQQIDVGQFVSRGQALARIYAVDYAEVRLPIPDEELAHLELPLGAVDAAHDGVAVELRARFAGRELVWTGRVVRTEAEIDERTRMVHVVARVSDPYAEGDERPPLAAGLFVEAEILGGEIDDALRLPRAALDSKERIWIVDADDELRSLPVRVLRVAGDTAWVAGALAPGDRIALSRSADLRDGLAVRPVEEEALARREAPEGPAS
jgi:RND family efflux transporter MFP subunit